MSANLLHFSDEELVKKYQSTGDKNMVGELFKRHSLMCYTVCYKYLKDEDGSQDAAMQIFEKLFGDLLKHEIQNFKSWLHTVCRNHCLMHLRKPVITVRMNEPQEDAETDFMELYVFLHQEENTGDKEYKLKTLEDAITQLKERQKECIELFYLQQKSYEEVSRITGYSPLEVKSYIQNGKRNLKIILTNKGISFGLAFLLWMTSRI